MGVAPEALAASFGPTLVIYDDVVLFTGGDGILCSLSLEDGRVLWKGEQLSSGHYSPEDVLVINGVAWTGATATTSDSGEYVGYDVHTGEVVSRFGPDTKAFFMHQRCYRSKATDRYLIPSRTGTEFIDPETKHWDINHWVRGGCIYGVMPSNGLLYATPHSCACYMESKLYGFNALAPAGREQPTRQASGAVRLEKGPAFGRNLKSVPAQGNPQSDWPTYRQDGARSGFTKAAVPAELSVAWQDALGGRLTSVVVAGGKLFLAQIDEHTVHALDAQTGKRLWIYTADGRVDSPPTIWQGRVLFGSADGWVYCLRATDGSLIWRFRAAPADERLTAFEQVESVWPVHGSVLVENDILHCVAGRSMFLDGGLRLLRLDPITGRKISETVLDNRDPKTGENLQAYIRGLDMPVALPDILSTDGDWLYMRSQQFGLDASRPDVAATGINPDATGGFHLFSPTGFLDGSQWHRSYWVYGKGFAEGAFGWFFAGNVMPAGHLLVFDDDLVYGYGRQKKYYTWTTQVRYQLLAMGKIPEVIETPPDRKPAGRGLWARIATQLARIKTDYRWTKDVPLHVRAIALADRTLFVAGPPSVVDEEAAYDRLDDPETQAKLRRQSDAFQGKDGGLLLAVDAADGKELARYTLDSPPNWDALAAAGGRLYMTTMDGKVLCMGKK